MQINQLANYTKSEQHYFSEQRIAPWPGILKMTFSRNHAKWHFEILGK